MFNFQGQVLAVSQNPAGKNPTTGDSWEASNLIQVMAEEKQPSGESRLQLVDLRAPIEWGLLNEMVGKKFIFPVTGIKKERQKYFCYLSCRGKEEILEVKETKKPGEQKAA
ncbi:MAG: hypothetical protein G3M70_13550 [Candidatus Nitronauta litoralis]|uniref:Uncharacterized protein n=1 Tax=Candidatus Nitronauta litoralis TaxID=2705533 RepID=A0A7T0BXM6_9BACT|nr:MAG: hypothetical protein G3M70_13550 [Candidatus Nitronauta litoralis]